MSAHADKETKLGRGIEKVRRGGIGLKWDRRGGIGLKREVAKSEHTAMIAAARASGTGVVDPKWLLRKDKST